MKKLDVTLKSEGIIPKFIPGTVSKIAQNKYKTNTAQVEESVVI